MRNCDHSNCWQGRLCQVERDAPRAAILAALASIAAIVSPVAYMLLGGPHA